MDKFTKAANQVLEVLRERNETYGDDNLLTFGLLGILVRLSDKLARLKYMLFHVEDLSKTQDVLVDIAGYAINALRLLDEGRLTRFGALKELEGGGGLDVQKSSTKQEKEEKG